MNDYTAFYKSKKVDVYAKTPYEAQLKAAKLLGAKKHYDVAVVLIRVNGNEIIHSTSNF